jgi:Uri superfamily endonuclease
VAFRAGALGVVELPPGWLMYVGSARGPGGLAARVGRHFSGAGRPRWHVDFLVRALPPREAWLVTVADPREAAWARAVAGLPGVAPVAPGFGASDSGAPTHLFHARRRPALTRFRQRLAAMLPEDPPPRRVVAPRPAPEALEGLKNLGPASAAWLREAGIHTVEQLARLGPVEAFLRVQETGRRPSVNLLYAVAGALAGCSWDRLPEGTRGALLLELDAREAAAAEGPWEKP